MNSPGMERLFKFTFVLGVILFSVFVIGIFLIIVKILLLFQPEIQLLGVTLS